MYIGVVCMEEQAQKSGAGGNVDLIGLAVGPGGGSTQGHQRNDGGDQRRPLVYYTVHHI